MNATVLSRSTTMRLVNLRLSSLQCQVVPSGVTSGARAFSSNSEPVQRLRQVLMHYKNKNFSRETPRRFKNEVLMPYTVDGHVSVDALNKLLTNIGYPDKCLSELEQLELLQSEGCSGRLIPLHMFDDLFKQY